MKSVNPSIYQQHTLVAPIHFVGQGLHSGKPVSMTLKPAVADSGYIFERLDVAPGIGEIPARWHTVTDTRLSTTIANGSGVTVSTVEHLMAALFAMGVDNCRIQLDGPEVPIMDGSSDVFVEQIQAIGLKEQTAPRRALVITAPIGVWEKDKHAGFTPFGQPCIDMTIDFENPAIGRQSYSYNLMDADFADEIGRARTFGFQEQLDTLQKLGLAKGGSLDNAILLNEQGIVNKEGLRYTNEFARHKLLDAIGDLSLAGAIIVGRFSGNCSGHQLNNEVLRKLLQQGDCWRFTTLENAIEHWGQFMDSTSRLKTA